MLSYMRHALGTKHWESGVRFDAAVCPAERSQLAPHWVHRSLRYSYSLLPAPSRRIDVVVLISEVYSPLVDPPYDRMVGSG